MSNVPRKLTLAERTALEEWCHGRPAQIAAAAHKFPPFFCYRAKDNPRQHYIIHSFTEEGVGKPVRCQIIHGADSTLPGVQVFGVDPESLVLCGCERWQKPTPEQVEAMREHVAALEKARSLSPKRPQEH